MTDATQILLEKGLVRYAGGFTLRVEHLAIRQGDCLLVQGKNGSGKSTLLGVLAGLVPLAEGSCLFKGATFGRGTPAATRRRIGVLLQEPVLFGGTVRENLLWPLKAAGWARNARDERLAQVAGDFRLDSLLDANAASLSVGQTRWIALARSLMADPELLLLDEPLAALDEVHRERFVTLLPHLLKEGRRTCVCALHEGELPVAEIRRCRLEGGRLVP